MIREPYDTEKFQGSVEFTINNLHALCVDYRNLAKVGGIAAGSKLEQLIGMVKEACPSNSFEEVVTMALSSVGTMAADLVACMSEDDARMIVDKSALGKALSELVNPG